MAQPRAAGRARPAPRGLRARPGSRHGLARVARHRHDARRGQRRRQPARALPRLRRRPALAARSQRHPGRRGLRGEQLDADAAGVPADPAHRRGVAVVPAAPRAEVCRRPLRRRPDQRARLGQPRWDVDDQVVHRRGARAGAGPGGVRGLPPRQRRRDPGLGGVRAAHPHGDTHRLHDDAAARRLDGAGRAAGDRPLLRPGLHDPAAAVAADAGGRDPRPLPARDGLGAADPRAARRAPGDPARAAVAAGRLGPARAARRARGLRRRTRRAPRRLDGRPRRRGPRGRRTDGRREVDAAAAAAALHRPAVGAGAARRHRPARADVGGAAGAHRLRLPGRLPLRGLDRRQHRLRAAGRVARGDRARGGAGGGGRVRRVDAAGLRHASG